MLTIKTAFGPEEVRLLDRAYTDAIATLGLPPRPASEGRGSPHLKVAHRIMHLALQGERDLERLRAAGVRGHAGLAYAC
jgi:hypothetical protein